MDHIIKRWKYGFQAYSEWRKEATFVEKLLLSLIFAFFTGISAQIYIRLPFTPVPVTGQVFVVLLSGIFLGRNWAGISQVMYLLGGISGIPWFAGAKSGILSLLPSFGYIIGFIPASFVIGYFWDRKRNKNISPLIFLMLAGIAMIYCCGAMWFSVVMGAGLKTTLLFAVVPFIPVDILKAYLAAYIAFTIFPHYSNGKSFKD